MRPLLVQVHAVLPAGCTRDGCALWPVCERAMNYDDWKLACPDDDRLRRSQYADMICTHEDSDYEVVECFEDIDLMRCAGCGVEYEIECLVKGIEDAD